ncbi:hypothetical protein SDC9_115953 [bioreactor metagenome]|uniref:Uncharacterized protein n=1 Tax=bioreactor metagenome TaxID=1076179 RepID=A0A645BU96_9ZZZZ
MDAPFEPALTNGSCAIKDHESCQVGNQAALSGDFDVPPGCLFRAGKKKSAHNLIFEAGCTVLFRILVLHERKAHIRESFLSLSGSYLNAELIIAADYLLNKNFKVFAELFSKSDRTQPRN